MHLMQKHCVQTISFTKSSIEVKEEQICMPEQQ